jgi:hypothetical protein
MNLKYWNARLSAVWESNSECFVIKDSTESVPGELCMTFCHSSKNNSPYYRTSSIGILKEDVKFWNQVIELNLGAIYRQMNRWHYGVEVSSISAMKIFPDRKEDQSNDDI